MSMQKITSLHSFILELQQIIESCDLKGHTHIHSSDPPLNFNELPQKGGGDSEKLTKDGGHMVQGQVFLKGGAGTFPI